jgi:SAM-dependent methyltransferase
MAELKGSFAIQDERYWHQLLLGSKEEYMRNIRKLLQRKTNSSLKPLDEVLQQINKIIVSTQPSDIPLLFNGISLDMFGELLLDVPSKYPNIKEFFPSMPPDDIQDSWNSTHGTILLPKTLAFIKTLAAGYIELTGKDLKRSVVLDYGCGWGRMIRLLYKYVPHNNIYGVDPWDKSINLCKQYRVKANLAICDYVPHELPFEKKFDLIFSFSVFTHLSEKTTKIVLSTLRRYINANGILVMTIRPKKFWSFHRNGEFKEDTYQMHEQKGFAFIPHRREPINGDITYGDTSISLGYIEENFPQWELVRLIMNRVDPYQTVLFLRPV